MKMAGKTAVNYAEYAFLAGVILAFVIGVMSSLIPAAIMPLLIAVMFILGIIVGVANIQEKETNLFLTAAIALLLATTAWNALLSTTLGLLGTLGNNLAVLIAGFTGTLVAFISPAAFILALKAVYKLAKPDI
jgi:MFS family permease